MTEYCISVDSTQHCEGQGAGPAAAVRQAAPAVFRGNEGAVPPDQGVTNFDNSLVAVYPLFFTLFNLIF